MPQELRIVTGSKPVTLSRLKQLEKKKDKHEWRIQFIIMTEQNHKLGLLVELSEKEEPLYIVENPKEPMKLRMVWNAAAEVSGVSLNSLYIGHDMI